VTGDHAKRTHVHQLSSQIATNDFFRVIEIVVWNELWIQSQLNGPSRMLQRLSP